MSERALIPVIDWIDEVRGEKATTYASFRIELDGMPVWPVWGDDESDLDIFVDDILAHLTDFWRTLMLRQTYPLGLRLDRPSEVRSAVEGLVRSGRRSGDGEEMLLAAAHFAEAHDLARCFSGQFELPAFWTLRQGERMLIETGGRVIWLDMAEWVRFADRLGDEIARRLAGSREDRWSTLLEDWRARDAGEPVRLASLSISQPVEVAEALIGAGLIPASGSVAQAANDNDALSIAARMIGAVPLPQISRVLAAIKEVGQEAAAALDEFAVRLSVRLKEHDETEIPHVQGVNAANAARGLLDIKADARVDPVEILERLGIAVKLEPLGIPNLDALAIWGEKHGPAVLINTDSKKGPLYNGRPGRAMSIFAAHELCHLLMDRDRAVAAVDILGGRMPLRAEQRANAFAAEFMLPKRTAADLWRRSTTGAGQAELDLFLNRLRTRFGVSRLVASWQLHHGLDGEQPDVEFWLDQLVPERVAY